MVYLPKEMPEVVLKKSGRRKAIKRFHKMQLVRSVLVSQKSSHLIIPKANLCQKFLVEQRLPINVDKYHNMGLYLSQPELFDEAVRELTRLFSEIHLTDLVSTQLHPLGHIEGVEGDVRYDNLPLYIIEKNGKKEGRIGLIDLEHIKGEPGSSAALETLARIFPFHLDIIKEEASHLEMEINDSLLNIAAEKGKKYLHVGFTNHLEWLKQKGISLNMPQLFEISLQRVNELTNLIEKELIRLNHGINDQLIRNKQLPENFFTENPEEMAKELAAIISPLIVDNIKANIEVGNIQLNKMSGQALTESEQVSLRSPVFRRQALYKGVIKLIKENPKINFERETFIEDIAKKILYVVMEELVRGGEIFFFDPAYYTQEENLCWIRY